MKEIPVIPSNLLPTSIAKRVSIAFPGTIAIALLLGCTPAPQPPTIASPTAPQSSAAPTQLPPPPVLGSPQAPIKTVPNVAANPSANPSPAAGGRPDASNPRGIIRFERGATSATVTGSLPRKGIDRYEFTAAAGQNATITIVSANPDVLLTLVDPQGSPIQRYQSGSQNWTGKLSTAGTYTIDVVATGDVATDYQLTVAIQP